MAQAGQRVVLVDCDLRRLQTIASSARDRWRHDGVADEDYDQVALATEVLNLSIPPTDPPNPRSRSSERFKAFLQHITTQFDRVIIDSSPIVPAADAAICHDRRRHGVCGARSRRQGDGAPCALEGSIRAPRGSGAQCGQLSRHEYRYTFTNAAALAARQRRRRPRRPEAETPPAH